MSEDSTLAAIGVPRGRRYWAFISYSQFDARWAAWLHRALETYLFPRNLVGRQTEIVTIPRRLIPVFRDREDLPSAGNLAQTLHQALEDSHALIVICSPNAAMSRWVNEEVRTFKTMGRSKSIFPLIVDGEPYAAQQSGAGPMECFPPALQFEVTENGSITDQRSDPLAADVREGRDGRTNAVLKLIAGIVGIGFDDLRRREQIRTTRRKFMALSASFASSLAVGATYVGLADANVNVPGGIALRNRLDRYDLSIFRRVASKQEILKQATLLRGQIRKSIIADAPKINLTPSNEWIGVWDVGQILSAVYRDPDAHGQDLLAVRPLLDQAFQDGMVAFRDGKPVSWLDAMSLPRAESAIWLIMALSGILRQQSKQFDATHQQILKYLEITQEIAEYYYPLKDGGWNLSRDNQPETHYSYTTALALYALLELDSNGLCWLGNCELLKRMIHSAFDWLVHAFVEEGTLIGWRRWLDDDIPPDPVLNIYVFGALGRASVNLGLVLPKSIERAAVDQLINLANRPYLPSQQDITYWVRSKDDLGRRTVANIPTRLIWYPWSVEALVQWLRYAEREGFNPETILGLERSLRHLVVSLSDAVMLDVARAPTFVRAETLYGLGGVR